MINVFQRLLYILGTISPYSIITSICFGVRVVCSAYKKCIEEYNKINVGDVITIWQKVYVICSYVPRYIWIIFLLSLLLLVYHIFFLRFSLNNLLRMDFHANEALEENDDFAKELGFVYLIPIIEWILTANIFDISEQVSGFFLLTVGWLTFFISLVVNKSYGSPVYLIMGYYFHTIQADGSKHYVLMSRVKNFRNKDQVKKQLDYLKIF